MFHKVLNDVLQTRRVYISINDFIYIMLRKYLVCIFISKIVTFHSHSHFKYKGRMFLIT